LDRRALVAAARRELGLDQGRPTLLVAGGSLGALRLNRALGAVAPELMAAGAQVLHLTGRGKADEVVEGVKGGADAGRYHVIEYLEQMELALAAADLVVGRAGAATVCELACAGLPAVLVPLRVGNGEQRLNARWLEEAGGAVVVADPEFAQWVPGNLVELLGSKERLSQMAKGSRSVAIRDGADRLVDLIEEGVK
jgi:UDP-N-acetylglucosamine:LPS N-acetylglucosamine transferase